ncbi:MAG TPA: DUF2219 family protein [Hellea balneolensis]|uniref:DUF2219 family protein n=1 Tax=Hellea balneolensis TaxID=287478 RepID=A0A7C5M0K8_9PROT|nr:DUF2219 family protein [Hellea balneolensis]
MKSKTTIEKKRSKGLSTFALAALSCIFSVQSFAQSTQEIDADKPVAARSSAVHLNTNTALEDVHPEKIHAPKTLYFSASQMQKDRQSDRNRWNPATLTQTTGLNAATISTRPNTAARKSGGETNAVLASDLINPDELLNVGLSAAAPVISPQVAPSYTDGVITLGSSVKNELFSPSSGGVNDSVFKLDLGERLCLGTAEECASNQRRKVELGFAKSITHGKFDGFNLQLTPHAGLRFDDDRQSAVVGALVRIGDNLREGSEMKSNTWYLFAGADAEAVTYTPSGVRRLTSGEFHLQDRIIVGDAQAGVGYRFGDADLALSYYKRQARAENYSYNEDAAALSITWKR